MGQEHYFNCHFAVEIDGIALTGFTEVLFEAATELSEYREGVRDGGIELLAAGSRRSGLIRLRTGFSDSTELYRWYRDFANDPTNNNKKNMSIVILKGPPGDQGAAYCEAARINVVGACPVRYSVGPLSGEGRNVLSESLEIVFEGFERTAGRG